MPPTGEVFDFITSAGAHSCGLRPDNTAVCWGRNAEGQLNVPAGESFGAITTGGGGHTCALRFDGSAVCWGRNEYGQADAPEGEFFTALAAGYFNTCGLHADGSVMCWGSNDAGQSSAPPGELFVALSGGRDHMCGQHEDGTVLCWGGGDWWREKTGAPFGFGTLSAGDFHTCNRQPGGAVSCWPFGTAVVDDAPPGVFAHLASGGAHACATTASGAMSCWGDNEKGQSSDIPPSTFFHQFDGGFWKTCSVTSAGNADCWGWDENGQSTPPVGAFRRITAGFVHACGVHDDGSGACWGYAGDNALDVPAGTFAMIGAGERHSCALATDGTLSCWGDNGSNQSTPPSGEYVALAVASFHNCAIRANGTLACWGDDTQGQSSPPGGTYVAVTGGYQHSCAIRSDGVRMCWGDPAQVPGVTLEPEDLASGEVGLAYSDSVQLASTTPGYLVDVSAFAVVAGTLPPGLSLSTAGELSGIPTAQGDYTFTIEGEDGNSFGAQREYDVHVAAGADGTPPDITPVVNGVQGDNGWYIADVSIDWTVEDNESAIVSSTGCGDGFVTADTAGTDLTCSGTSAGGAAQETVTIRRDATAPDTQITTAPGSTAPSGATQFSFDGTDATSGVARFECALDGAPFAACTSPHEVNVAEGPHSFAVRAFDAAGHVDATPATHAWTAQGDGIPPVAHPVLSQPANANGWHRANVTVDWGWTDEASGIDRNQCTEQSTSSGEGVLTISATCSDRAGNQGSASLQVRVDRTAPVLSPTVSPPKIVLNGTGTASAGAMDAVSGVASQSCAALVTNTVGTKTSNCTATDLAGNTATGRATYRVIYGFVGFAAPVGNPPTLNLLRNTAIAPLRWRVVDANGIPVTTLKSAAVTAPLVTCPGGTPVRISIFGTSTKLVHLGNGNYELGWKPSKSDIGKCRQLNLSIGDGETYPALFQFD